MKNKGEASAMKMADGAACPMMKKETATAQTVSVEQTNVVVATGGESCSCSCCGTNKEKKDVAGV